MKLFIALFASFFLTIANSQTTLRVGTTSDNPPFASLADNKNNFFGFEIDLMMEICRRIDANCQFKPIVVSDVRELFDQHQVDLVIAAIIAPAPNSPECEGYIFSMPYLPSSGQFLVRADSKIETLEDIRYKKIGARLGSLFGGTLFKDSISQMYKNQVTVSLYLNMCDLLAALQNQEVSAIFTLMQTTQYWYINNKSVFRLIGEPIPIGNGYSIMGQQGEENWIIRINQALYSMEQDGTYTKLYDQYFSF